MSLRETFRLRDEDRMKTVMVLVPCALFFWTAAILSVFNHLASIGYQGHRWPIFLAFIAGAYFESLFIVYVGMWHRVRSVPHLHRKIQSIAIAVTFVWLFFAVVFWIILRLIIVGFHDF